QISNLKEKTQKSSPTLITSINDFMSYRNPLWATRKPLLFLGHPRRIRDNGSLIDLYTDPLLDLLSTDDYNVLSKGFESVDSASVKTKNIYYFESFDFLIRVLSWFHRKLNKKID